MRTLFQHTYECFVVFFINKNLAVPLLSYIHIIRQNWPRQAVVAGGGNVVENGRVFFGLVFFFSFPIYYI